jgi:hypothetical protein
MNKILLIALLYTVSAGHTFSQNSPQPQESDNAVIKQRVSFKTSDLKLLDLYDRAEQKCLENIRNFNDYRVLVEGAGYSNVWLETQPMSGEMYAKRDLRIALENQLIFMDQQRADGRMPGMVSIGKYKVKPHYGWFQGFCFPEPALDVYYWMNKDRIYLEKLYKCLKNFDDYLWKVRDSDGDGCLETWCVYDTGEDNCVRLDGSPFEWPYETAPTPQLVRKYGLKIQAARPGLDPPVPIESMDIMSYSYSSRAVLAKIASILNNGRALSWDAKATAVRDKLKAYLWDAEKSACYDRDAANHSMNILLNNNIRCMYYGSFDQQMADAFIHKHLFNPKEFWTPMPLPSIAANDPKFRNAGNNDWSGQSQGLTFQRSIKALENYGHYAEVVLIADRLIKALKENGRFTQQYDPFTGKADKSSDGYGPTMLSLLEYISRMYGIHYSKDELIWSGLHSTEDSYYTQVVDKNEYSLSLKDHKMMGYRDNKLLFTASANCRIITNMEGKITKIIGIDSLTRKIDLATPLIKMKRQIRLKPNDVYSLNNQLKVVNYSSTRYR